MRFGPALVTDASVVAKWLLPEVDSDKALELWRSYALERTILMAPGLLMTEVSDVLCRHIRRGLLAGKDAYELFGWLIENSPVVFETDNRLAFTLGVETGQHVHDCVYLALALSRRCDLVTADERFHSAVTDAYPNVKLLRDL